MTNSQLKHQENAAPFFDIVMEGLRGEVDGATFWEAVADDAVFDFLYHFPGFTTRFEGREAYRQWFEGYGTKLHAADNLRVYKAGDTIILEYQVHGTVPGSGKAYDNRFCSIVTLKNRKIVYWRDYMDSLAAMNALM